MSPTESGPGWVLHCGRWQDVLAYVTECDAVITDPPYSARTHEGQSPEREALGYDAMTPGDVADLVASWAPRTHAWVACMTDDVLAPAYRDAYQRADRLDFAAVPILQHRPRLRGDGPGSGTVWMLVSRPRSKAFVKWGSLPCWYQAPPERGAGVLGAKPLGLMRAIIRDYSRPGDLIVDPCAGGGTTLLAAVMEGRRAIGAEMDPETFRKAVARLRRGHTRDMFSGSPADADLAREENDADDRCDAARDDEVFG
jgi:site-specific DNA-methyltransferase (adenine-specific)